MFFCFVVFFFFFCSSLGIERGERRRDMIVYNQEIFIYIYNNNIIYNYNNNLFASTPNTEETNFCVLFKF